MLPSRSSKSGTTEIFSETRPTASINSLNVILKCRSESSSFFYVNIERLNRIDISRYPNSSSTTSHAQIKSKNSLVLMYLGAPGSA